MKRSIQDCLGLKDHFFKRVIERDKKAFSLILKTESLILEIREINLIRSLPV